MKVQSQCPKSLKVYEFKYTFSKNEIKINKIWEALKLRETFVKGQLFPYKVEFDSATQKGPFEEGELSIHHGPLISLHGAIGRIDDDYRDLQYFYGSYVFSFRWIRPTRLEFFKNGNEITVKLNYYVKWWVKPFWAGFNWFFWRLFAATFIVW